LIFDLSTDETSLSNGEKMKISIPSSYSLIAKEGSELLKLSEASFYVEFDSILTVEEKQ
jgi:hypothetical protein